MPDGMAKELIPSSIVPHALYVLINSFHNVHM